MSQGQGAGRASPESPKFHWGFQISIGVFKFHLGVSNFNGRFKFHWEFQISH